jgi:hypothetical protein
LNLLREYIARLETAHREKSAPYERILLITHENLRQFYEKAGFEFVGPSAVVHGSQPWYEMRIVLGASSAPAVEAIPPGVFEALKRPSNRNPASKPLSSFAGGITEVSFSDSGALLNKFDLLCPRSDCGSVILKRGVAKFAETASVQVSLSLPLRFHFVFKAHVQLEPANHPGNPLLPVLPQPPAVAQWWLITPSAMEFENIGFSRPVESLGMFRVFHSYRLELTQLGQATK